MSASAVNKLQDALSRELSWRKKEISALRSSVLRRSLSEKHFTRAGVVMLCAHWEGFLRSSIQAYVDHVFSQGLPLKLLSPKFVAISLFKDIKNASESVFPDTHSIRLANRYVAGPDALTSRVDWRVDTGGSAGSKITGRILATVGLSEKLGLDDAAWTAARTFIDEQLLKVRHKIAHGEGVPVGANDFMDKTKRLLDMLDVLAELIIDAAAARKYLVN